MIEEMDRIQSMLKYAICEIAGKQYKLISGKPTDVFYKFAPDQIVEPKTLLLSENGKLKLGKPYLNDKIILTCVQNRAVKIQVRKFHAKANYRRTTGSKSYISTVILPVS